MKIKGRVRLGFILGYGEFRGLHWGWVRLGMPNCSKSSVSTLDVTITTCIHNPDPLAHRHVTRK